MIVQILRKVFTHTRRSVRFGLSQGLAVVYFRKALLGTVASLASKPNKIEVGRSRSHSPTLRFVDSVDKHVSSKLPSILSRRQNVHSLQKLEE